MQLPLLSQIKANPTPTEAVDKAVEHSQHLPRLKVALAPYYLSTNPYQKQLHTHLAQLGIQASGVDTATSVFMPDTVKHINPDILHLHWLHIFSKASSPAKSFLKLAKFVAGLLILKLSGIKIVWTAHNLRAHESPNPFIDRLCRSLVIKLADQIIAHGEVAKQELLATFNIKRKDTINVIPHGNYIDYYQNEISRTKARKLLRIDDSKMVFLFLGTIRPYKGVNELIEIFNQLDRSDVELVIAGKPFSPLAEAEIRQKIGNHSGIKFIPGFVPADQIQIYMNAADLVVFPYRNLLTSGAAILAMSFGKACLAPRIGCLKEILNESGAFLYDPTAQNALPQAIHRAIEQRDNLAAMGKHNRQIVEQWSWDRIASMTSEVYQKCFN
jgi:beta-1,4-mannosyltransferase